MMSPVLSAVGDELLRRDEAARGVAPPQQRLHRVHLARFERDDRLVPELELVARRARAAGRCRSAAGRAPRSACRGCRSRCATAQPLGAIHRRVGVAQQVVGRRCRRRVLAGDADAERHEHLVPLDAESLRERAVQAVGHLGRAVGLAQAAEHDHELVAAHAAERRAGHQVVARRPAGGDARHRVAAAQAAVEPPRGLAPASRRRRGGRGCR